MHLIEAMAADRVTKVRNDDVGASWRWCRPTWLASDPDGRVSEIINQNTGAEGEGGDVER